MTIYDLIEQQRAALLSRDATFLASMTQDWRSVERAIAGRAEALARELEARKASGQEVSQSQLFRLQRYQALARQAREAIVTYAGDKAGAIADNQRRAVAQGEADARAQLDEAGVDTSFMRLNQGAVNVAIGLAADGSPLRNLLAATWPDAVDALTRRLIDNTALGVNPRVTARQMAADSGASLSRMMTIARTEQLRAYREASRATYQAAGIRQYKRIAAKNARTCYICISIDGQIIDVANPMPVHPNCRCGAVPIVPGYQLPQYESAQEWFGKQPDEVQRAMLGAKWRYDDYKNGARLQSFVSIVDHPIWGPTLRGASRSDAFNNPNGVDMGKVLPVAPVPSRPRPVQPAPVAAPPEPAAPAPTPQTPPAQLPANRREALQQEARAKRAAWLAENSEKAARIMVADKERKAAFRAYQNLKAQAKKNPALEPQMLAAKAKWSALYDEVSQLEKDLTALARPLFIVDDPVKMTFYYKGRFDKDDKSAIDEAAQYFLQLVSGQAYAGDNFVSLAKGRAGGRSYASGNSITLTHTRAGTIIHELGHIVERGELKAAILEFYNRRTQGYPLVLMSEATGNAAYDKSERTRVDKFLDPYMGKLYSDMSTELLSMGVEYMYTRPWDLLINDEDYYEFLYVLLRGGYGVGR